MAPGLRQLEAEAQVKLLLVTFALSCGGFLLFAANEEAPAKKQFEKHVSDYLELRKQAVANLPKVKEDAEPERIRVNKLAQADAVRAALKNAKQGHVFAPEFQQYVRSLMKADMKGSPGKAAKETAMAGNPSKETPATRVLLKVGSQYPETAPLSSVPPSLLLKLPELPKELDYRFVGRNLILHDVNAGVIVDFIPNVLPE